MFVQHHNFGTGYTIRCGQTKSRHNSADHLHQFFEIDIVLGGEIDVTLNGKTLTARAGDIIVIPAFATHSFLTRDKTQMMICVFSGAFLSEPYVTSLLSNPRRSHIFHPSESLLAYLDDHGFLKMWGHYEYYEDRDADDINFLRAIFHIIFAEYFSAVSAAEGVSYNTALPRVLAYMSAHFTEDLSLKSVGAALGYSPKYISNCISTMPNITFRTLLNAMRVERAKELLRSEEYSNYEVAIASGFNAECSFHRVFKEFEGCTPGEYRARKRAQG